MLYQVIGRICHRLSVLSPGAVGHIPTEQPHKPHRAQRVNNGGGRSISRSSHDAGLAHCLRWRVHRPTPILCHSVKSSVLRPQHPTLDRTARQTARHHLAVWRLDLHPRSRHVQGARRRSIRGPLCRHWGPMFAHRGGHSYHSRDVQTQYGGGVGQLVGGGERV